MLSIEELRKLNDSKIDIDTNIQTTIFDFIGGTNDNTK